MLVLKTFVSNLSLGGTKDCSETYRLLREYQGNPSVPLLDIVGTLRKTRARMLDVPG